jgi:predicted nucleic acid-binding protein
MKYVLDACAVIAHFNGEEGANVVTDILSEATDGDSKVLMHSINLFEFYYDSLRSAGTDATKRMMVSFKNLPITLIKTVTEETMKEAARFKLGFKISVADAFALATAKIEGATLITTDHHEFDPIEAAGEIPFKWVR